MPRSRVRSYSSSSSEEEEQDLVIEIVDKDGTVIERLGHNHMMPIISAIIHEAVKGKVGGRHAVRMKGTGINHMLPLGHNATKKHLVDHIKKHIGHTTEAMHASPKKGSGRPKGLKIGGATINENSAGRKSEFKIIDKEPEVHTAGPPSNTTPYGDERISTTKDIMKHSGARGGKGKKKEMHVTKSASKEMFPSPLF